MRIIGHIEHPHMKITAFKMDNRLSVKFELGLYEQLYKFRESEFMKDMTDVEKMVDATFIGDVLKIFDQMHRTKKSGMELVVSRQGEDEFPEII